MKRTLLAESHRRQFNGEDYQAVAIDVAERNGFEFDSAEYTALQSAPDQDCKCGFCATADWIGSNHDPRHPALARAGGVLLGARSAMKRNRMTACSVESEQTVTVDGEEYTVSYTARGSAIYAPGRFTGPPEDCYPDESECDVKEVRVTNVSNSDNESVIPEKERALYDKCVAALDEEKVADELWTAFTEAD
jgi:hypothetical protein